MIIALKAIREASGLSVDELAEKSGLSKMKIWNYESGRNQPDPEALCSLADALDVSLDMLIRGKEKDRHEERSFASVSKRFENFSVAELRELGSLITYLQYRKEREQSEGQGSADSL